MMPRLEGGNSRKPFHPWASRGRPERGRHQVGQPSRWGPIEKYLNLSLSPLPSNSWHCLSMAEHAGSQRARAPTDTAHEGQLPELNCRWKRLKRLKAACRRCPVQKAYLLPSHFLPKTVWQSRFYSPGFIQEAAEVQRGTAICPKSHS